MLEALADALQYTSGLLLSPIPIAAMIALLLGGDAARPLGFGIVWVITTFAATLALSVIVPAPDPGGAQGEPPEWANAVTLVLGVGLLVAAALLFRRVRHRDGPARPPGWMRAIDSLALPKVLGLAVALVLANPINLSMVVGAGFTIGSYDLSVGSYAVVALVFALIGSLGVLAPLGWRQVEGNGAAEKLGRARHWLIGHDAVLSFGMFLIFGLNFAGKGLLGLVD